MENKRFVMDIVGQTPLVMNSNSALLEGPKKKPEGVRDHAEWEREHFLDKTYRTASGALCIPERAIKKMLVNGCKFCGQKPKGTSFKSFGPLLEAALIVEGEGVLDTPIDRVVPWTAIVGLDPSKGPKGPRGPRTRPLIPLPWATSVTVRVFDALLTRQMLQIIAEAAGWKCGILDGRAVDMGRCDITVKEAA